MNSDYTPSKIRYSKPNLNRNTIQYNTIQYNTKGQEIPDLFCII